GWLKQLQEQVWNALVRLLPWELVSRWWDHVQDSARYLHPECGVAFDWYSGRIAHSWFYPNCAFQLWGSVFLSPLTFPFHLWANSSVSEFLTNFAQLAIGGLVATAVVGHGKNVWGEGYWSYGVWIGLTLLFTTILSIPVLVVMWLVALALGSIVGPETATLGAAGGSLATGFSVFAVKAADASVHQSFEKWLRVLVQRLVGRAH